MFHNKQFLIGIYDSSLQSSRLVGFSVTTSSGTILVNWGDGSSRTIDSNTPTSHSYTCPDSPAQRGLWNDINPCP
jgi:hypothetical protein